MTPIIAGINAIAVADVKTVLAAYVHSASYKAGEVKIAGRSYTARDLSADELKYLTEDLESLAEQQSNPLVANMIARNSPRILDLVRVVNAQSGCQQGYGGAGARGNALVVNPLRQGDVTITHGWQVAITAIGATTWIGSSTSTIAMTVSSLPVLGHIYLGFVDPIEVPKVDAVQLVKNGDPWPEEVLVFNWRHGFGSHSTPVHELKQPWIVPPGENYYIPLRYNRVGDDRLEPIAFTVKRASDILTALA